jgi:hypothetical protein
LTSPTDNGHNGVNEAFGVSTATRGILYWQTKRIVIYFNFVTFNGISPAIK